ncbi:MAG TPA: hypothetical protein VMA77_26060, partial [Solirubrobacteraceae bacterium]|nr:hypothetical protein [Solirubrobacteraceae bacterium]
MRSEFERLLADPGCPACRHIAESERNFLSWFEIESHTSPEMQAELRRAMGMCPAHTRRLLGTLGAGDILTIVMREAVAGARRATNEEVQVGPCPACASVEFGNRRARTLLIDSLQDQGLARRYAEHGGVCLVHLVDALPAGEPATLKLLAERLLASLHDQVGSDLVHLLAGGDADARRRAMWRDRLPALSYAGSTVERLSERLEIEACPVCLAAGVAERDYFGWLFEDPAGDDPSAGEDP